MSIAPQSIQLATGAVALNKQEELDFVMDAAQPLHWQRTYQSQNAHIGLLGQGWTLPISYRLVLKPAEQEVLFIDLQGREIAFAWQEAGETFYSQYEHITLLRTTEHEWELQTPDGIRLLFTSDKADSVQEDTTGPEQHLSLQALVDSNGNGFMLRYNAAGLPVALQSTGGYELGFVYHSDTIASPRLSQVWRKAKDSLSGPPSESTRGHALLIQYRYSSEGDLIEVLDAQGVSCQRFTYINHMMVERQECGGLHAHYEWSEHSPQGQVIALRYSGGMQWCMHYEQAHRITRVTQNSGNLSRSFEQTFDHDLHLICEIDAQGHATHLHRDEYGNVLSQTSPQGHISGYQYDHLGRLTQITLPDGSAQRITWHPSLHKPTAITDPLGHTTHFKWDERGNLLQVTDAAGHSTHYRYERRGLPSAITDANGKTRQLHYNQRGQLIRYTDCSGQSTELSWDDEGNLLTTTDALGQSTHYTYERINRRQRLVMLHMPDGSIERFAYDKAGRLTLHQDPLGNITGYKLDAQGNPLARTNALGYSLQYHYDGFARLIRLDNENGAHYRFSWDELDQLIAEQSFDGRRLDYRYNQDGHLLEMADGQPHGTAWMEPNPTAIRTHYQRDPLGRLLQRWAHKPGQRPLRVRYQFDAAGQLTLARNADTRVELTYTPTGELASETLQTRWGQTSKLQHSYDALGNRNTTTLPDGRTINLLTYGSGHVHQINLDGQLICDIERDALHREIERTQGQLSSRYQLDPVGRLLASRTNHNKPAISTAHNTSGGQHIARRYQYNQAGQLLRIDDSRNGTCRYQYDVLGRLQQAQTNHALERFAFDPAHNLIDPTQASGPAPRAVNSEHPHHSIEQQQWAQYVQEHINDPDFNPLGEQDHEPEDQPQHWGKIDNNRLKVWQEHRYDYDHWGNCIQKRSGMRQSQRLSWDAEHQLSSISIERAAIAENASQRQIWRYAYDAFGRRIAKWPVQEREQGQSKTRPDPFAITHFTWDGNRLLAEYRQHSPKVEARVGTVTEQATIKHKLYLYEPESFVPLAQVESSWRQEREKQALKGIGMGQRFLQQITEQAQNEGDIWADKVVPLQRKLHAKLKAQGILEESASGLMSSRTLYYHTDHLGTPRELTDAEGNIVWAASYKAWGQVQSIEYPALEQVVPRGNVMQRHWQEQRPEHRPEQNLRFQGQYYDEESGLHYNRFRYYDPEIGRFINQDSIRLRGGLNFYHYALNPIIWIDPWGLTPIAHQRNGRTLCIKDKFRSGSPESKELNNFVNRWNQQIKNNGGSMTRRVLSEREQKDSDNWRKRTRCQCTTGKVAGHVPDAAAGGSAIPLDWMEQFPATNGYLAGIVRNLPVGYTYDNVKLVSDLANC